MGLECFYSLCTGEYYLYLIIMVWSAYTVYLRGNITCTLSYGFGMLIQFMHWENNLCLNIWVWSAYTVHLRSNITWTLTNGSEMLIKFI